jgi:hypothetical protein
MVLSGMNFLAGQQGLNLLDIRPRDRSTVFSMMIGAMANRSMFRIRNEAQMRTDKATETFGCSVHC